MSVLSVTSAVDDAQGLEIQLPAETDLAKLTDLVARFAAVSVEYAPQRLRGTVRLRIREQLNRQSLWAIYNQVLNSQGFATIVSGQPALYQVVPVAEAVKLSQALSPEEWQALPLPPSYVVLTVPLEHIGPELAIKSLGTVFTGQVAQVRAMGQEQYILLAGTTGKVTDGLKLLKLFDRADQAAVVGLYKPTRAGVKQLQTSLQQTWKAMDKVAGFQRELEVQLTPDGLQLQFVTTESYREEVINLARQLDQSEPVVTQNYRPRYFAIADVAHLLEQILSDPQNNDNKVTIIEDTLTNSLIVKATAAQHQRVQQLLADLDNAPEEARRQVRRFVIKNRSVDDMAAVLQGMVSKGVVDDAAPAQGGDRQAAVQPEAGDPAPEEAAPTPAQQEDQGSDEDELLLSTDPITNTLIAIGEPRMLTAIEELIAELDERQPQVEIDVMMVNLSDNEALTLSAQMQHLFDSSKTSTSLSGVFGDNPSGLVTNDPGNGIEVTEGFNPAAGFSGFHINPGDFAILVNTLQTVADNTT